MADEPERWEPGKRESAYHELDHPADVLLEVWGDDLSDLFENALFALYDQLAELEGFDTEHRETITVRAKTPAEALRSLLSEALYRFSSEKFVAARARLEVKTSPSGEVEVKAKLYGDTLDKERHTLLAEVKAVTYHRLAVEAEPEGGWRATVLLDV